MSRLKFIAVTGAISLGIVCGIFYMSISKKINRANISRDHPKVTREVN